MLQLTDDSLRAPRAPRRTVRMDAQVIARCWDLPRRHSILDLGPNGLRVHGDEVLAEGEHVVVAFRPPGGRLGELTVFARVAHARRAGMGLELLDVPVDARVELVRAIARPWSSPWSSPRTSPRTSPRGTGRPVASPTRVDEAESVEQVLAGIEELDLTPAALGGLLTGGRRPYRWWFPV